METDVEQDSEVWNCDAFSDDGKKGEDISNKVAASSSQTARGSSGAMEEMDFDGEEGRPAKMIPDPGRPTEREKQLHRLTHMPFRAWCSKCVQGRGRDVYHGRVKERSRVARVCMDFMFLTERGITTDKLEADKAAECI